MTATANELAGKRALVTGAGKRVGRAIALALGREGMHVAVHYHRSADGARAVCEEIVRAGGRAFPIQADLADRQDARRLLDESVSRLGGLDLLVPSAANFERVAYDTVDDAAWDRAIELNLTSPGILARRASPALRASKGSIVFITCSSATVPFRNYLPYVVSKGGLRTLMRTLSLELAPDVRVNAVAPGTVLPPENLGQTDLQRIEHRIPLGRFGSAEDVADAVVFLAASPFVTGHEVVVDGGRSVAAFERFG